MTSSEQDLRLRLDRLERSNRGVRFLAAAATIGLLATWSTAAVVESREPREPVRTRLLVIEDAEGRDRIVLGAPMPDGRDNVGLKILNPDGAEQFGLGLDPDGSVSMGFDTRPSVGDPRNSERLNMGVTAAGRGWIRFLDNRTRARLWVRLDSAEHPVVQLQEWREGAGIEVEQLGVDGDTTLVLRR